MRYCELRNVAPFNWEKALNNPPPRSSCEHKKLSNLAYSWVTCACGNQCEQLPRDMDGVPLDYTLESLGMDFAVAVETYEFDTALTIMDNIEKRVGEILKDYD